MAQNEVIPKIGDDVTAFMGGGNAPAIGADVTALMQPSSEPSRMDRTANRRDANIIGIDYDWIADKASRLPDSLRKPVAAAAAFLGYALESASAPESVATMGFGRVPSVKAPEGYTPPPLPRPPMPTGRQLLRGVQIARHPVKESLKVLADELIARMEPAAAEAAPQVGRLAGKAPTLNESLESALNDLRQSLPAPAMTPRLPEYPQAAADTMRGLEARPPVSVRQGLTRPTPAPAAAEPVPSSRPVPAPAEAPPVAIARPVANPGTALQSAKDAFAKLGESPRPAEASNAGELIRRGVPPEQAVAQVIKNRPQAPLSPAEQLAKMPGAMSDAERRAAQDLRYAQGKVKTPSAETARERRGY